MLLMERSFRLSEETSETRLTLSLEEWTDVDWRTQIKETSWTIYEQGQRKKVATPGSRPESIDQQKKYLSAARAKKAFLTLVEEKLQAGFVDLCPDWLREASTTVWPAFVTANDYSRMPALTVCDYRLNELQVAGVLSALSRSTLDRPAPLVVMLKQQVDPISLDLFAWDLLDRWLQAGAPPKTKWALIAVGLLGGDVCAIKLTPHLRVWPKKSQNARAMLGLECLRTIGSDTALMQIDTLAQTLDVRALKARAGECMREIAKDRGLTLEQLEDRIVPWCSLNEQGTRTFDFGSRQFQFMFDPRMLPRLVYPNGNIKTAFPAVLPSDDATKAAEANAEWTLIKKQIANVIKMQTVRLEQLMVKGRRWSPEEFETWMAHHPIMGGLMRRIVWGVYDADGKLELTFLPKADRTYSHAGLMALNEGYHIGIVHPLQLSEEVRAGWVQQFKEAEIEPLFDQLERSIFRLESDEAQEAELTRFAHRSIDAAAMVAALEKRGWMRGKNQDGGMYLGHFKPFSGANVTAVVEYEGIPYGYLVEWHSQKLERCYIVPGLDCAEGFGYLDQALPWGQVDPVVISEVLKDLDAVAGKGF